MAKLNLSKLLIDGTEFPDAFDLCNDFINKDWNTTDIRLYDDRVLRFTINLVSDFETTSGHVYVILRSDGLYTYYLTNTLDHIRLINPNLTYEKFVSELNNSIIPVIFKP